MTMPTGTEVSVDTTGSKAIVYAGDYLNRLSGEQIEYACRRELAAGCKDLVVNFSKTEIVNSIGISILLNVIDNAADKGAAVSFTNVNQQTAELFEMLGITRHVAIL